MICILLLVISTVPALKTLFIPGFFSSHDGEFHLIRLINFFTEITKGQFPVRFSTELAYGYGYPIYNFFYPLIYYLGSVVHLLGFNFSNSLKIIIGISTVMSVCFCYLWLRQHFNKLSSFVGAFLYLYVPYRFLATYVNGAFGIVLSLMFAPLIFYGIYGLFKFNSDKYFLILSISLSMILISHNVSAMIFIVLSFCYICCLCIVNKNYKSIKKIVISFFIAIGISSFFLIPMFNDLKYVNLSKNIAVNYKDHWPSIKQLIYSPWGYEYSNPGTENDGMSFQLGIAQLMVIIFCVLTFIIIYYKKIKLKNIDKIAVFFIILFFIVLFFTTDKSGFFWRIIPLIKQIQFPWRLLMAQMLIFSFLSAWLISFFSNKKTFQIFLLLIIIFVAFWGNRNHLRAFRLTRNSENYYFNNKYSLYSSTDIAWENRPIWVNFIPQKNPKSLIYDLGKAKYYENKSGYNERFNYTFESNEKTEIILNIFYYINWRLILTQNDNLITSDLSYDKDTGLLKFTIPEGITKAKLIYQETNVQKFSDLLTIISVIIWLKILFSYIYKRKENNLN